MTILRVSDICGSPVFSDDDDDSTNNEANSPSKFVVLPIMVLALWTDDDHAHSITENSALCRSSVARVSLGVLKALQLFEGSLAWIRLEATTHNNSHIQHPSASTVAVYLELMDEHQEAEAIQMISPDSSSYDETTTIEDSSKYHHKETMIVCIPPIVAWNLGVTPLEIMDGVAVRENAMLSPTATTMDESRVSFFRWWQPIQGKFILSRIPARRTQCVAQHVLLQPLGRGPHIPLLKPLSATPTLSTNSTNEGTQESEDSSSWIYPSTSGSLLQFFHIICVPDPRQKGNLFYYLVLRIRATSSQANSNKGDSTLTSQDNDNDCTSIVEFAITGRHTKFELDPTPLHDSVPRLPPLPLQVAYYDPFRRSKNLNASRHSMHPSHNIGDSYGHKIHIPPHPNVQEVAQALFHQPDPNSSGLSNNQPKTAAEVLTRILHVVGTDANHDLCTCIETAAHWMGYQYLPIRGLAAFAYNQGHIIRGMGGLLDQLAGITCALEYIQQRRMEPCVLHFQDINEECAVMDEPLRLEQQDRFWNKFIDGLMYYSNNNSTVSMSMSKNTKLGTPPLLIVLSTTSPLQPGPWMERLVFPSIVLSTPDDPYIRYLWTDHRQTSLQTTNELSEEMLLLLRGRTAKEIRTLERNLQLLAKDPTKEAMTYEEGLKQACATLDQGRRKATSQIAKIAPVYWSDVGGLQHVRTEIMDAIELPLKHPHLFPHRQGGRSGILLYGPPGTGKTLVAKAVATECQLPFLSVKGPELLGSYVGESEANVRNVFASARQAASANLPIPAAILFFDELDSLAPRRGGVDHGGGVMERVVASLLSELDGSSSMAVGQDSNTVEGRVFVLGATNRPDLLDPSLLRPGRLDRLVYLGIPTDSEERVKILASRLAKMKLADNASALEMAVAVESKLPPRLSGADMAKLSSDAMLNAVHRLCHQAEQQREQSEKGMTVQKVLEGWTDEQCTPIVTLEDLMVAAKDCSPSVSLEELRRYEQLRESLR